jgi:hypothetical protein
LSERIPGSAQALPAAAYRLPLLFRVKSTAPDAEVGGRGCRWMRTPRFTRPGPILGQCQAGPLVSVVDGLPSVVYILW